MSEATAMKKPQAAATKKKGEASKAAIKMKGPGQITTVNPNKHNQFLSLAEWNHQSREKLKALKSEFKLIKAVTSSNTHKIDQQETDG